MAARLIVMCYLLEAAKRKDDLEKRRQASKFRKLRSITRNIDFIRHYRLSEDLINILETDIGSFMRPSQRFGGLDNKLKILIALSFMATGSYQKVLTQNIATYVSQSSASRAIHEVVSALNQADIVRKYIRFPQNTNERQALKERFYEKFNIPGVLGCVDGTLVAMVRPQHNEERYYCRKGYHARNVLIISDADLNILHVDVTFGGATHDSHVFSNSCIKQHLEQVNSTGEIAYLLGDSGYAQRPYLMTPCPNPQPGSPEEHYNNIHCSARNSIERTIGILKGRFRCLLVHRVLHYDPNTVGKIVVACCVLHNMCNRAGLPAPLIENFDLEQESTVNGTFAQDQSLDLTAGRQVLINQLWRAN